MVRKPAIHGHYKAEEEKAWYNNYKDFMSCYVNRKGRQMTWYNNYKDFM